MELRESDSIVDLDDTERINTVKISTSTMSPCCSNEIFNEALIRELQGETGDDVLLFAFDGFIYFGNLQRIDDCRCALLCPAITSETGCVAILTPCLEIRLVDFVWVDLCTIVGKGISIVNDPIAYNNGPAPAPANPQRDETDDQQESHLLIRQLCRMVGDDVVIKTRGGFLFEGTLDYSTY